MKWYVQAIGKKKLMLWPKPLLILLVSANTIVWRWPNK